MNQFSAYEILLVACSVVIVSYLFSVIHRLTRIPSVLLLLGVGIGLRYLADVSGVQLRIPPATVEVLGTLGLIMIVLEAGLDLEVRRNNLKTMGNALRSAAIILLLSTMGVAALIKKWIPEADWLQAIVYALPLCVVSSAIVLPSVHHLSEDKREFLVYEAAFSDVIGIMLFNFLTAQTIIELADVLRFLGSIPAAILLSIFICFGLMWLLVNNRANTKFFLVFAVLTLIYMGGKGLQLPSLLTILLFGLVINNWEWISWPPLKRFFSDMEVNQMASFLKSITAETAFVVRTFFFLFFGYSIDLSLLNDADVLLLGSSIVLALLALRFLYLRILHRYELLPELFYFPRGLITVLLFYKIPAAFQLIRFNEGVLFFVVLSTSAFMMVGALLYRDHPQERDYGARSEEPAENLTALE